MMKEIDLLPSLTALLDPKQLLSTNVSIIAVLPAPGTPVTMTPLLVGNIVERCSLICNHNQPLPYRGDGTG